MTQPILDLSSSGNLEEIYEVVLTAALSPVPGYHIPISLHQIPGVFDCHTLVVGANSFMARPNWRLGFYLRMLIASSVGLAEASNHPIPLGLNLIRLPRLSSEYRLRAYIPKWHQSMEMKIWKYIGTVHDCETILDRVENRIILLSSGQQPAPYSMQATFNSMQTSSFTGII